MWCMKNKMHMNDFYLIFSSEFESTFVILVDVRIHKNKLLKEYIVQIQNIGRILRVL